MTADRRPAARTPSARKTTTARRTSRRTGAQARSRRGAGTRPRRRTPTVAAGVGTALGLLVVTWLLDLSGPVRIGVLVLAAILALAFWALRRQGTDLTGVPRGHEGTLTAPIPPTDQP